MGTLILNNPLATVQLIPIYSYLNILGDFLFLKNYLTKDNQTKEIPIINALYEYLDEKPKLMSRKITLIQQLLEGSDLYGEKPSEIYDTTFANAMFDYIISSVVFGKYGNIFGFLAVVVRDVENLEVDHVLEKVKESLNSTYENNFGEGSKLSHLAINRIYNDMILPLFPQTKNMSLLSLDYMFAQAGAIYLRTGRLNDTYDLHFIIMEPTKFDVQTIFNECLIVGHVIKGLLHHQKMDPLAYRAFALPVLLHYVSTEKAVSKQSITKIIFRPNQWDTAYRKFREYVYNTFNQIEELLRTDNVHRLHKAFSRFQTYAMMANSVLNSRCLFIVERIRKTRIPVYMEFADEFECRKGERLPNLIDWFQDQLHSFGELYGIFDLKTTQQHFVESLKKELHGVVIKLIVPNNKVFDKLSETLNLSKKWNNSEKLPYSKKLPYDLLEFDYKNESKNLYVLKRENYTVRLIKETDDPEIFNQTTGPYLEPLIQFGDRVILKFANESLNDFTEELMKHKKQRFKTYLNYSDDNPEKSEWWKEFGLSFVESYPCISNTRDYQPDDEHKFCEQNTIKFLDKFPDDVSSFLVNRSTRSFLSSVGTTPKRVFIKLTIDKSIEKQKMSDRKYYNIYEELSLYLEKPNFETKSIFQDDIMCVQSIINDLKGNIGQSFQFVDETLHTMEHLVAASYTKHVGDVGKNNQSLFVNTMDSLTGYGYKFINMLSYFNTTAQLRTGYDFKEKMLISLSQNSTRYQKIYIKLNNVSLDYEPNYFIYEINDQLRRKAKRVLFSRILIHQDNNEKCENSTYLKLNKNTNVCLRYWLFNEKINYVNNSKQLLKHKANIAGNDSITEEWIQSLLTKYIITNDNTSLVYLSNNYLKENFEESMWAKKNAISSPNLLNKLRYDISLDDTYVSIYDGERRIDSLYHYRERREIEREASLEVIIKNYNDQKAHFAVSLEDYYAIRNFATSGERRITADTNEAKHMKLALFKLAVRQYDDLDQEFDSKLYRIECKPMNYTNSELSVGKEIIFRKFTSTSLSVSAAVRLGAYAASGFRNILYEIEITGPYMRAKIEVLQNTPKRQVILLPGIQFNITKITLVSRIGGLGNALKVVLNAKFSSDKKFDVFKSVMREIGRINL